jgi:exopolyphosphatase/guanosine-5'-triphosphate,3'-diphosphate pyrophosphatase
MGVDDNSEFVAALDLGTNTFNLAIARSKPPFTMEFRTEKGVFLGKGGLGDKIILEDASIRAQKVLEIYSDILSNYPLNEVRCVATEAIRNAKNAHEVLSFLEIDVPFTVETIPGEQEALLVYKGVKSTGILGDDNVVIMDIGGGSIEFIIANVTKIHWKKSFKIGTSRVLEDHPLSNPPIAKELELHYTYYSSRLDELDALIKKFDVNKLIGTAGSFDAWRKILSEDLDSSTCLLDSQELEDCINRTNALSIEERVKIKGMEEMRIETIVPAGILVTYLLDSFNFKSIYQCSYALAEGVLWEMINE